uniref:NADH-ubiquinone oxidoreductase chain 2 n=1 Tax=Yarrowia alimentaria TaxID=479092 RepID=G4U4V4_9ASCO|nr:NADH dehydrogenase subunit 2 [Yarrowia alimentaria]CCC29096.1 subunit ND2 of proton translocating NADH:ubiquinone oxidoreductase [Yarrowia alimentaria]
MLILAIISTITFVSMSKLSDNRAIIRLINIYTILVLVLDSFTYTLFLNNQTYTVMGELLMFNSFTFYMDMLMYFIMMVMSTLYGYNTYNNNLFKTLFNPKKELIILFLINILGALLIVHSNDFITLFVAMELQSYSIYLMTAMYNSSYKASKASMTYFFMGGMLSMLMAYSMNTFYSVLNSYTLHSLDSTIINTLDLNTMLMALSLGLLFKMGMAPLHKWLMSIYENTPILITVYMSLMPKVSMLSYLVLSNMSINSLVISMLAILTLLVGSIGGLLQMKIKRLLAFSGLTNAGYMMLLLLLNNNEFSYLYYMTQYSISHLAMFMIIMFSVYYINYINNQYNPMMYVNQLKGLMHDNAYLVLSMSMVVFSFMGMPPLLGFFGKLNMLMSMLNNGYYFMSIVLIIASLMSALYYTYLLNVSMQDKNNMLMNSNETVSSVLSYVLSSLMVLMTFGFIYNSLMMDMFNVYFN